MTILACSYPECDYRTDDVAIDGAAALLTIHGLTHPRAVGTPAPAPPTAAPTRGPKLERPRVKLNVSSE